MFDERLEIVLGHLLDRLFAERSALDRLKGRELFHHIGIVLPGRLPPVLAVSLILARSSRAATPATLDLFDKADKNGGTTKHDTLTKDVTMGTLLVGKFTSMTVPAAPVGDTSSASSRRAQ